MTKLRDAHPGDYDQLDHGTVEYQGNEVHLKTDYDDPPGLSGHNDHGDGLLKLSGKHQNAEQVLVQFKRTPNGGEIYFGVLDQALYEKLVAAGAVNPLDRAMIEMMTVRPDGVEFHGPIKTAASAPAPSAGPQQITSKDGRYLLAEQNDGNLVVYDRGVAVWDRWSYEAAHG